MVFLHKELADLAPYSERTFYRRLSEVKKKRGFKLKMQGNYLSQEDALIIADLLGFKKEFETFLKDNSK